MQKELNPTKSLCIFCRSFRFFRKMCTRTTFFILIFFMTILSSVDGFSQKCSYEKNEIDALTELQVKRTTPSLLLRINGQPLYVKAQCIGDNKYLKLLFYHYNDFSFQEDREISFILSNNEEIILYPRVMPVDSSKIDDITNVNSLLIYKLTSDQFQKLLNTPVTQFKYFIASGFLTEPVKGSKQNKVMEVLRCVE